LREPAALPSGRWRCPSGFSGVEEAVPNEQFDDVAPQVDLHLVPLLDSDGGDH
jgi:hypothetical protein